MTSGTKINHKLLRELGRLIFIAAGSSDTEAAIVSDHLVDANLKGHDSHGVVRISKYVDWVKNKEHFNASYVGVSGKCAICHELDTINYF